MNNLGQSLSNIHIGDTLVEGDLTVTDSLDVKGDIIIEGKLDLTGDLEVDGCVVTNCVKEIDPSAFSLKNSSDQDLLQTVGNDIGIQASLLTDTIKSRTHDIDTDPQISMTATGIELKNDGKVKILVEDDVSLGDVPSAIARADGKLQVGNYTLPTTLGTVNAIMTSDGVDSVVFQALAQNKLVRQQYAATVQNTSFPHGSFQGLDSAGVGSKVFTDSEFAIGTVIRVRASGTWVSNTSPGLNGAGTMRFNLASAVTTTLDGTINVWAVQTQQGYWEVSCDIIRDSATTFRAYPACFSNTFTTTTLVNIDMVPGTGSYAYDAKTGLTVDVFWRDDSVNIAAFVQPYFNQYHIDSSVDLGLPGVGPSSPGDHLTLDNLVTGDAGHTQFALLAGRPGGQSLNGGTGASDYLFLRSNSIDVAGGYVNSLSNLLCQLQFLVTNTTGLPQYSRLGDEKSGLMIETDSSSLIYNQGDKIASFDQKESSILTSLRITAADPVVTIEDSTPGSGQSTLAFVDGKTLSSLTHTTSAFVMNNAGGSSNISLSNIGVGIRVTSVGTLSLTLDGSYNKSNLPLQMLGSTIYGNEVASGNLVLQSTTQATRGSVRVIDQVVGYKNIRARRDGFPSSDGIPCSLKAYSTTTFQTVTGAAGLQSWYNDTGAIGSRTFPANSLAVGDVITFVLAGRGTQAGPTVQFNALQLNLNGASMLAAPVGATIDCSVGMTFNLTAYVTIWTTTTCNGSGMLKGSDDSLTGAGGCGLSRIGTQAISLATANTFDVVCTLADPTDSLSVQIAMIKLN